LAYDGGASEVFIPNKEVADQFVSTLRRSGWGEVIRAVEKSTTLLEATWREDGEMVADIIEAAHLETSHLTYNTENALAYTVSLAYYAAREYYMVTREMPTGKGFADMVFRPRLYHQDKPAIVIELKWDKSAKGAIAQIHRKQYPHALTDYKGKLLLVGINYDKSSKHHTCLIERA
jgi:hypothetical protein